MSDSADAPPGFIAQPATPPQEWSLAAQHEAEQVVRVFLDPDLGGSNHGDVMREDDEDEERHARRAAALDRLFGTGR